MTYTSKSKAGFGRINQAFMLSTAGTFALLATTMLEMKRMIDKLTDRELR